MIMKITPAFAIKKNIGAIIAAGTLMTAPFAIKAQNNTGDNALTQDIFQRETLVTPSGTTNARFLACAPDPSVEVAGEKKTATIVVDLSNNTLYHYDEEGNALAAYLVASGKPGSKTPSGLRIVNHVETYPYKEAPPSTKRRRQPWNYGPKAIILDKLDPYTGEASQAGIFIHGNNDASSIGEYASLGCIRMDNEVIKELSQKVKRGDIVLFKR